MNDLTPELRPDKNGHMVTRWVRKGHHSDSGKRSIPGVSVEQADQKKLDMRARRIARLSKTIVRSYYYPSSGDEDDVADELNKLSDETLKVISAALKRDKDIATIVDNMIGSFADKPLLRELVSFASDINGDADEGQREGLIVGLKEYDIFAEVDDLSKIDPKGREIAVALLNVGYHVLAFVPNQAPEFKYGLHSWNITDEKLLSIVLANPEKANEISRFISERKTDSGEALEDYFNGMSAIREGTL